MRTFLTALRGGLVGKRRGREDCFIRYCVIHTFIIKLLYLLPAEAEDVMGKLLAITIERIKGLLQKVSDNEEGSTKALLQFLARLNDWSAVMDLNVEDTHFMKVTLWSFAENEWLYRVRRAEALLVRMTKAAQVADEDELTEANAAKQAAVENAQGPNPGSNSQGVHLLICFLYLALFPKKNIQMKRFMTKEDGRKRAEGSRGLINYDSYKAGLTEEVHRDTIVNRLLEVNEVYGPSGLNLIVNENLPAGLRGPRKGALSEVVETAKRLGGKRLRRPMRLARGVPLFNREVCACKVHEFALRY